MKRLFMFLMLAATATMFTQCSKDHDDEPTNQEGMITMVETRDSVIISHILSFKPGETIIVDWGDGNVEEFITPVDPWGDGTSKYGRISNIKHLYSNQSPHTITIKGKIAFFFCNSEGLTSLDASQCPALNAILCEGTALTHLDVSNNPSLTFLYCRDNKLTSLNVSRCPALEEINCEYNKLTILNASGCKNLKTIWGYANDFTSIDVSGCTVLRTLSCGKNNLTSIDVSECTELGALYCYHTNITSLDISKNTKLKQLVCNDCQLSASALNQIFSDLPQGYKSYQIDDSTWMSGTNIYIGNNPGSDSCNRKIAEDKKWTIYEIW